MLEGGYASWKKPRANKTLRPEKTARCITVDELKKLDIKSLCLLDVRKPVEVSNIWFPTANCISLN